MPSPDPFPRDTCGGAKVPASTRIFVAPSEHIVAITYSQVSLASTYEHDYSQSRLWTACGSTGHVSPRKRHVVFFFGSISHSPSASTASLLRRYQAHSNQGADRMFSCPRAASHANPVCARFQTTCDAGIALSAQLSGFSITEPHDTLPDPWPLTTYFV